MRLAYLGIILGVILLTSAIGTSHASTGPEIKILAKEKRGMIMLLVKNGQNTNIYSIKITLLDGEITSVKDTQGWTVKRSTSDSSITLTTDKFPIKPLDRALFFLGASKINTIISWSAIDRFGSTIYTDSTRTIFRQTLDRFAPTESPAYISNARIITVTTDKIFYNKNDKMFISGALEPKKDLTITIYAPNGQMILIKDTTDVTGSFKVFHVLHDAESGTYQLQARQADGYAETTFKVL